MLRFFETTTIIAEGLEPVLYRVADLLAVTPEFLLHGEDEEKSEARVYVKIEEEKPGFEVKNLGNGRWEVVGDEIERAFRAT